MDSLSHQIIGYIATHPHWALVVIGLTAFGESFVFVSLLFPGTTILIAAGALVESGALHPVPVVLAGSLGAILGDAISFWIGRRFRTVIPEVWPFRAHPDALQRGVRFFRRYGWTSVFIGRFFGPLRAIVSLVAGMMRMRPLAFYAANCLSALVWAPVLVMSGFLLSTTLLSNWNLEDKLLALVLLVAAIVAVAYGARRIFRPR